MSRPDFEVEVRVIRHIFKARSSVLIIRNDMKKVPNDVSLYGNITSDQVRSALINLRLKSQIVSRTLCDSRTEYRLIDKGIERARVLTQQPATLSMW